jgi:hypothetical protein
MKIIVPALAAMLAASASGAHAGDRRQVPVLVELFTSESCSSCPPADAVLAHLLARPPEGVQVVALGEHVDYWDGLGWKDRFSAPAFTLRQERYARRLELSGPYTPQMVVGGTAQLIGGDEPAARAAIAAAARGATGVAEAHVVAGDGPVLQLDVRAEWDGATPADVLVAVVQDHARTSVAAGENAGRVLEHVAVARALITVAHSTRRYHGTVELPLITTEGADRVVVIVQDRDGGPVRAVATEALGG